MLTKRKTFISFGMLAAFMLLGLPVWAAQEDYPKAEVFGGYSYSSIDPGKYRTPSGTTPIDRGNGNGWGASFNGNVNQYFGLTADFAGHYGNFKGTGLPSSDFRVHEFLFGPTVSARGKNVTGFAHVLLGAARFRTPGFSFGEFRFPGASATKFAMGIGGGVDLNVNRNVAVRAIEFDYLPVRIHGDVAGVPNASNWSQSVRLKTGIVFKF